MSPDESEENSISDNSMLDGIEDDDEKWEKESSNKDEDALFPLFVVVKEQEFITQERSREENKDSPTAPLHPQRRAKVNDEV